MHHITTTVTIIFCLIAMGVGASVATYEACLNASSSIEPLPYNCPSSEPRESSPLRVSVSQDTWNTPLNFNHTYSHNTKMVSYQQFCADYGLTPAPNTETSLSPDPLGGHTCRAWRGV